MQRISIHENGLYLELEIEEGGAVRLLHFSALPFDGRELGNRRFGKKYFTLVEVMLTGNDRPGERFGNKYEITSPGDRLVYVSHEDGRNETGRFLNVTQRDPVSGVTVVSHLQFFNGIPFVRSWTDVINTSDEEQGLEYVSSFALTGIMKEGVKPYGQKLKVRVPNNSWFREMQWVDYDAASLGLTPSMPEGFGISSKAGRFTNVGHWSSKEFLPMGYIENTEAGNNLIFQIEHNGSWHWEIADHPGQLYLQLSGPNEIYHHFWKGLKPGETFTSVPAGIGSTLDGFDGAIGALTRYRRAIRRPNRDNENLGVIFNDYMNCLFGNPTSEKEYPLIDAAAEMGCEYYCIDCGWYSEGFWWDSVGEWKPAEKRFPEGLPEVLSYIRKKGMIPGLWLEIEVMGVNCPKLPETDDSWYFLRHGKRVMDRQRYQLDFRSPAVVAHANEVIDRLVRDYGVGYIKMDYNIEPGIGTETGADSFGDGLLQHERAYLAWLDDVFRRYPDLVIENCSSGSMRMDYAMLSRHSIQSTSDQTNYANYASISANAPATLTPEQAAVWTYPLRTGDREEVVFNMVNAVLLRIHQSGHLAEIDPERKALVREAIDLYKTIRADIKDALPFWPLGLSSFTDEWVSMGLRSGRKNYVAVWRRNSHADTVSLPIAHLAGKKAKLCCLYPSYHDAPAGFNTATGLLTVRLPEPLSARLFELEEE